jgi:hypothetical protein
MNENTKPNILTEEKQYVDSKPIVQKRPDEAPGLNIEAKFKIFDPETGNVIVEGRA